MAPDGGTLAITTDDGGLEFWDARTRRPLGDALRAHAQPAWSVAFSADGRWLATGGGETCCGCGTPAPHAAGNTRRPRRRWPT